MFREFAEFDCYASGYLQYLNEVRDRETKKARSKPAQPTEPETKTLVVCYISSEVASQSAFSIINDGTQDVSKKMHSTSAAIRE